MSPSPTQAFREARDFLLAQRGRHDAAVAGFRWPQLQHFNWALDWFDVLARDNPAIALWVVNEDGSEQRLSFAQMAERSNRVAHWLRSRGVKRGDRMLLMLGNVVPLWELTLAAIKLGAVVSPATTLLSAADLADRVMRGQMRHVVADAAGAARFAEVPGDYTRTLVGGSLPGWTDYALADAAPAEFEPDGPTRADDPLLLYFTSGTTAQPKMVLHTQQSYPVGHLTTMYWLGLRPGDVHLNISSPGWGKHAWSSFYAPWNAGATIFVLNQARFDAEVHARHPRALWRDLAVRAAHGLARADPGRPGAVAGEAERGDRRRRAAEPGSDRARARRLGVDACATATARPKAPAWSATHRGWRCAPARWVSRCRATAWCCSTPRTANATRANSRSGCSPRPPG